VVVAEGVTPGVGLAVAEAVGVAIVLAWVEAQAVSKNNSIKSTLPLDFTSTGELFIPGRWLNMFRHFYFYKLI
jgi:hypothetical protein